LLAVVAVFAAGFTSPGVASAIVPLSSFGKFGEGAGEFRVAGNLDVAPSGLLYVPDSDNNRVDVFTPEGEFRFAFGKGVNPNLAGNRDICTAVTGCIAGEESAAAGGIVVPQALAVSPEGDVYVASSINHRVDVFSSEGEFRFAFGKEVNLGGGPFCTALSGCRAGIVDATAGSISPIGVAVDSRGSVYLAESLAVHNRVDVFSAQGGFEFAFGKGVNAQLGGSPDICTGVGGCQAGANDAQAGALSGAVDLDFLANGDVAVLTFRSHRVNVFTRQGEFRFAFGKGVNLQAGGNPDTCTIQTGCKEGGSGSGAGELGLGTEGIAADSSGALYIAEAGSGSMNERVAQFTGAGAFVRAFGAGVIDGKGAFQVCTAATGCRAGLRLPLPGAVNDPHGIAVDDRGTIYVSEAEGASRIQRFREPDAPVMPPGLPGPPPSNRPPSISALSFRLLAVKLNPRKGTATLAVKVSRSGRVFLKGTEVPKAVHAAKGAGIVRLPVVPVRKAKRKLSETGKATVRIVATFIPVGSARLTKGKTLVLKKNLR
jgi:DNA-binding beta-propeller fold protein YncE